MELVYVAWWSGRGYLTIWTVVGSVVAFALLWTALRLPDGPWMFGLGLLTAAGINWCTSRNFNKKSLAKVRSSRLRERLLYRAGNRFVSLPMETFSLILAPAGLAIIAVSVIA